MVKVFLISTIFFVFSCASSSESNNESSSGGEGKTGESTKNNSKNKLIMGESRWGETKF